ncbi:MAG: S8 family peptidase [Pseudomonadota bacterium]
MTKMNAILKGSTLLALMGLGLSGCDQRAERLERAGALGEAVIDQVLGSEGSPPSQTSQLEQVPLEARAMAGTLQAKSADPARTPQLRYVVGAIVAKPKDLPPPVAIAAVMAEPQLALDVVTDRGAEARILVPDAATLQRAERNPQMIEQLERPVIQKRQVTVVDPRVRVAPAPVTQPGVAQSLPRKALKDEIERKRLEDQGLSVPQRMVVTRPITAEQKLQQLPTLKPQIAERALTMRTTAMVKQLQAEDRLIEAASKYQVAASIQRSRTGQMVIEIGADAMNPTRQEVQEIDEDLVQPQQLAIAPRFAVAGQLDNLDCSAAVPGDTLTAMECMMRELRASGDFEYVEKDYLFEHQMIRRPEGDPVMTTLITPNDPLFGMQWHYRNQGEGEDQSPGGAGFVDFWTRSGLQSAPNVNVAVIDTGLDLDHPDLINSPNIAPGWDMISDLNAANDGDRRDSDPDDPGDACPELGRPDSFHGTHVAGTIGAGLTNNGAGIAGGAWNVTIVPVRAIGKCGGRLSDINDAIRWAAGMIPEYDDLGNEIYNDYPADIINLSLGLFKTCPASMQDAIDAVVAQGVIVVAAAGNERIPTDFFAPAGCRNVLTVAGGDARGHIAPYSNYGDAVDLLAPGGDMTRDDNGDLQPDGVLSMKTAQNCRDPLTGAAVATCYYAYEQGTSMAAPHVSAALALLRAQSPDLTASELVANLMSGLTTIPSAQCTSPCLEYPGAEPTLEDPDLCLRPCGQGLLNLAPLAKVREEADRE